MKPARNHRRRLHQWPVIHFLAIGVVLFAARAGFDAYRPPVADVIAVPAERSGATALEPWLTEEILVREALRRGMDDDAVVAQRLALNLDFVDAHAAGGAQRGQLRRALVHSDPVIRRRLAQRMRFGLEAEASDRAPDPSEIRAHIAAHPEAFLFPGAVRIEQIFFAFELRGDRARADADAALARLATERNAEAAERAAGDPLAVHDDVVRTPAGLAKFYGPAFARAVMLVPLGEWSGPLASTLGVHVVLVVELEDARPLTANEARPQAVRRIQAARREAAYRDGLQRVRARYEIRSAARQG